MREKHKCCYIIWYVLGIVTILLGVGLIIIGTNLENYQNSTIGTIASAFYDSDAIVWGGIILIIAGALYCFLLLSENKKFENEGMFNGHITEFWKMNVTIIWYITMMAILPGAFLINGGWSIVSNAVTFVGGVIIPWFVFLDKPRAQSDDNDYIPISQRYKKNINRRTMVRARRKRY
ncbi:hypothetical protein OIT44_06825 [Weissella ceti]|uniref:Uncharacterized protein n=1 Tax=Weissella ceti TaxID=759620 RepID=A0ABT3E5R6_9LACO|nr:hypothetical protein [Weissella ceti]MCW0953761.1 hypothetical protein [Weissella ceti]QVK11406.1 hypothetical protein KHQ31_04070 [Weissella ceti]